MAARDGRVGRGHPDRPPHQEVRTNLSESASGRNGTGSNARSLGPRAETVRVECPSCGVRALDFTHRPHRDGGWTVLVHCFGCGAGLNEVNAANGIPRYQLLKWPPPPELAPVGRYASAAAGGVAALDSNAALDGYHEALWSDRRALDWLHARLLGNEIVKRARLGYDDALDAITIPVPDADGEIVNVRRRFLAPDADPPITGLRGRGTQLYPLWALDNGTGPVMVTEGEMDALTFIRFDWAAVTTTGGRAQRWDAHPEWLDHLRGRVVAVSYDADATAYGQQRVDEFRAAGISAYLVDMNRSGYHGKTDVNDLVAKHGWTGERLREFVSAFLPGRRRGQVG